MANAAKCNASAVLIYPDPVNYDINDDTALFGHVSCGTFFLSDPLFYSKFMYS